MKNIYGIIYLATNNITGKKYIGKTCRSLCERKKSHSYSSTGKFAMAINEYGFENFSWKIIDTATTSVALRNKENRFIKRLNTKNIGYNSTSPLEGKDNISYSIFLPSNLLEGLKVFAFKNKVKLSEAIRLLLFRGMEKAK